MYLPIINTNRSNERSTNQPLAFSSGEPLPGDEAEIWNLACQRSSFGQEACFVPKLQVDRPALSLHTPRRHYSRIPPGWTSRTMIEQ